MMKLSGFITTRNSVAVKSTSSIAAFKTNPSFTMLSKCRREMKTVTSIHEFEQPASSQSSLRMFSTKGLSKESFFNNQNQKLNLKTSNESSVSIPSTSLTELKVPTHELKFYQDAVEPYYSGILKHSQANIHKNKPPANPLDSQKFISKQMRFIIFNWLIENAECFKLRLRTLFLASNIMDRYLSKNIVLKEKFQLIGVTALFIASKFEDVRPPSLRQMGFMLDEWHEKSDILTMEAEMFSFLNFDLHVQLVVDIADLMLKVINMKDQRVIDLVNEVLLVLVCYHYIDKFDAQELSVFAITYALKHYDLPLTGLDHLCRITDCEYWYFSRKVKKILTAMDNEKLEGIDRMNKVLTCGSINH